MSIGTYVQVSQNVKKLFMLVKKKIQTPQLLNPFKFEIIVTLFQNAFSIIDLFRQSAKAILICTENKNGQNSCVNLYCTRDAVNMKSRDWNWTFYIPHGASSNYAFFRVLKLMWGSWLCSFISTTYIFVLEWKLLYSDKVLNFI